MANQKATPMTLEELKKKKAYLDVTDITLLFGCGTSKAYAIMRSIKYYTDKLGMPGKVLFTELEAWMNDVQIKI